MRQVTQNNDMDLRLAARHSADYAVSAVSKAHGTIGIHIVNISAQGFMIDDNTLLERGDRVEIRLPIIGRIEALTSWTTDKRAGFQFERVIRLPDFVSLLKQVGRKLR